jgi:putative Mg2+ transporter-C (MgtC) family protein
MPNLDTVDVAARLVVAVIAGAVLGINRDLHRKPAGLRTHALVSLGSATSVVVVLSTLGADASALSRVIQGLVTGVGFIGAGVILHRQGSEYRVAGLTTAASIWVAAALGLACGSGLWFAALLALALTLAVLAFGGPIEQAFERRFGSKDGGDRPPPDA